MIGFNRAEIELTSHCNASCPGCARTQLLIKNRYFPLCHLDEEILYDRFSKIHIKNFHVKFCGVLGDPLIHPKILDIIKWFLNQGRARYKIEISTNASLRSENFWVEIGKLSAKTKSLDIIFAVDGLADTNSVYRVNTNFQMIIRNMKAYTSAGGTGRWLFIEFDHNLHQKDQARNMAQSMNLDFYIRRATRNIQSWTVTEGLSNKKYQITTNKTAPHQKIDFYKKVLNDQIESYDPHSINCKFTHGKEFFLACDGTVWPCCFLWDEYIRKSTGFYKKMELNFPTAGWNSIYKKELDSIFSNNFYFHLSDLWDKKSPMFTKRCYSSCGEKGLLRNSLSSN